MKPSSGDHKSLTKTEQQYSIVVGRKEISLAISATTDNTASGTTTTTPHHNRFTAFFPGPPGWAVARTELLDFILQEKINRGRYTDHPAGRHSIRTNPFQPHHPPIFFTGRMPFLPPNQQCQSTEGINLLPVVILLNFCSTGELLLEVTPDILFQAWNFLTSAAVSTDQNLCLLCINAVKRHN